MRRLQVRLGTLILLIAITALGVTLFVQRRREAALNARLQAVEEENEWVRLSERRLRRVREAQINELRYQISRQKERGQDSPARPTEGQQP